MIDLIHEFRVTWGSSRESAKLTLNKEGDLGVFQESAYADDGLHAWCMNSQCEWQSYLWIGIFTTERHRWSASCWSEPRLNLWCRRCPWTCNLNVFLIIDSNNADLIKRFTYFLSSQGPSSFTIHPHYDGSFSQWIPLTLPLWGLLSRWGWSVFPGSWYDAPSLACCSMIRQNISLIASTPGWRACIQNTSLFLCPRKCIFRRKARQIPPRNQR